MSSDHQDTSPPYATGELHRQPSSRIDGKSLLSLTNLLPSPMTPTNLNSVETNSTPGSKLAAAIGRVIFNIPQISVQDSAAAAAPATTTKSLLRTFSDADSSANQITTTTPPKIPSNGPLRRALSDTITVDYEQTQKINKKTPLRRSLSDTSDLQQPRKTQRVSSSPQGSPQSDRLRKIEDMVKEIEHRCREIMREEEQVEEDTNPNLNSNPRLSQEQDECVGVERLKNGDLRFELSCSCGKSFEMIIKHNGYCFYRLT